MATARTVVTVLDHGAEVEAGIRRPVRLTPDGHAGVAYAGSVYPLHTGNVVELNGPSWELADCERFLFAGADVPYASAQEAEAGRTGFDIDWYVETGHYSHSVVFNAPERIASQFIAALEDADISVQRWDVSHRAADNGNFYDWFARLRFKGSRDDALAMVRAVTSPPISDVTAPAAVVDPIALRLSDAEARIEQLLDQLFGATKRAEAAEREVIQLRGLVDAAQANEHDHREALATASRRHADLQEQIAALRERIGTGPDAAALVKNLAEAEELREMALAENSALFELTRTLKLEVTVQRQRANELADQVADLKDQLIELQTLEVERMRAAAATRRRRGGVVEFLAIAFDRIEFVLDAVDVIASLESPAKIVSVLSKINDGEFLGREAEGLRGWFEVENIPTGKADDQPFSRLYFRSDGQKVLVSVDITEGAEPQRRHRERLLPL